MKKLLLILLCIVVCQSVFASETTTAEDILNRFKTNRAEVYAKLNLSEAQAQEINKIDAKVYEELNPQLEQIAVCIKKIDDIAKSNDCTIKKVNEVKKEFKGVDKEISTIRRSYEKEFKTVLTREQKPLYKTAKKEQRAKIRQEIEELKAQQKNSSV